MGQGIPKNRTNLKMNCLQGAYGKSHFHSPEKNKKIQKKGQNQVADFWGF